MMAEYEMNGRELSDCRLYGILDLEYVDFLEIVPAARAMIAGGVDLIQLRGKKFNAERLTMLATELHRLTSRHDVPLIINDHAAIACSVGLEGVHVGQSDLTIADVRALVGRPILVGKSTHSFEQAISAEKEGADYIGFGPLFQTPTKPDYSPIGLTAVRKVHEAVRIPIFCIGGIKLKNLTRVLLAGAERVVIVSELLQSENIEVFAGAVKNSLLGRSLVPNGSEQSAG